jgi:tRNA pseudouridine38-40 synthase
MRNIHLVIAYDGSKYNGFQSQPHGNTIQDYLEKSINEFIKENVKLYASGRTDTGVHAIRQHISFETNTKIDIKKIKNAINTYLPETIRVIEALDEGLDFNARYSVASKTYIYKINKDRSLDPFFRDFAWNVDGFNIDKLNETKDYFLGEHDFTSFCSAKTDKENKVRIIHSIECKEIDNIIEIRITGNGFLYNMVRIIIGYFYNVSIGKIDSKETMDILKSKERKRTTLVAPGQGLYLYDVLYNVVNVN